MTIIICGRAGRVTAEGLHPADKKTLKNFTEFLGGKGTRCPHCLHRAKRHDSPEEVGCTVGNCDCTASPGWIERWWVKRRDEMKIAGR